MTHATLRRTGLAAAMSLAALLGVLIGASQTQAVIAGPSLVSKPAGSSESVPLEHALWSRMLEAVVLKGSDLPAFASVSLHDLFAYQYTTGSWLQIPFQFDEVDASGVYTTVNGILDAQDELVFMAMNLGEQAPVGAWIADPHSRLHPRYSIELTNPLAPGERGWVYLYRSPTLAPMHGDYVDWDPATNQVIAGTYIAGFSPTQHVSLDSWQLNSAPLDALDRGKLRLNLTCYINGSPYDYTATEQDLVGRWPSMPNIDGAVRVGGGSTAQSNWFYRSLQWAWVSLDVSDPSLFYPCESIEFHSIRASTDWLDPATSGMAPMEYFDPNTPAGVAVDGSPDAVPDSPAVRWREISGGEGSVVQVQEISPGDGTVGNYYKDDVAPDPYDTGDKLSFGDAGFEIRNPTGTIRFSLVSFVLDPYLPNVGETYQAYCDNPLQFSAGTEDAGISVHKNYLPLVVR